MSLIDLGDREQKEKPRGVLLFSVAEDHRTFKHRKQRMILALIERFSRDHFINTSDLVFDF